MSFFAVGDTGDPTPARQQVIQRMVQWMPDARPEFILLLGDNFYEEGVRSVDDALWQTEFEQPFSESLFPLPFYALLGNHDHRGRTQPQVDYTATSDRWRMPDRYYSFKRTTPSGFSAEFFVLDTTAMTSDPAELRAQGRWLEEALRSSTADARVVAGHHPILSGGSHGPSPEVGRVIGPLLETYGVCLYVSGHDHDLQLLDSGRGWLQVVSGAGSRLRSVRWLSSTRFAEARPGFAWIMLSPAGVTVEFVGAAGHRFTASDTECQPRRSR